jgi:2-oxoglutarate ferredoxin oxidoreductase subunit beta
VATFKEFRNNVKPNWCPGCGDFSVQAAIQRAAANVGLEPEQLAVISGIGCSGRISGYINGDGFAIGMGHTVHAIRRNLDITYIVMDNQIYGLTKGQTSPRSAEGFKTKSTPEGSIETTLSPLEIALSAGATFVAQSFSSDLKQLTSMIEQGLSHKGFSLINVFSPCVTFNKVNTYDWFKENVVNLEQFPDYDPSNRVAAMTKIMETNGMLTGLIYQNKQRQSYEDLAVGFKSEALAKQDIKLSREEFDKLLTEFK